MVDAKALNADPHTLFGSRPTARSHGTAKPGAEPASGPPATAAQGAGATPVWQAFMGPKRAAEPVPLLRPQPTDLALEAQARALYDGMGARIAEAREAWKRPLTLAEKILVNHTLDWKTQVWERGKSTLQLRVDRVAMQDATAQMAVLQFMQSGKKRVAVPATIHCDHLIRVQSGAKTDLARALDENKEVYAFLESAARKYGVGFWRPGSGIIHQVVLEQYAIPGALMIGADSHTPNAGGLGMMAIGVGGSDVGEVMAGLPWEVTQPKLIGVRLTGALDGWASPKDVITHLCGLLTVKGGTNQIIEYFGPGCETISATGKATMTNMGAEMGATTSIFPFDDRMAKYLRWTNRGEIATLAEKNAQHLTQDPEVLRHPEKYYDQVVEIDLSKIEPMIVGPHSPDRARPISEFAQEVRKNGWPAAMKAALIGSCTNSSYQDMSRAASVAMQGVEAGLTAKTDFKIAPGSEQIFETIRRDGMIAAFEEMGGCVFSNSCGACIGQWCRSDVKPAEQNSIVSSFNRNFPGRNDGSAATLSFLASPEIVTAMALAGRIDFDPAHDALPGPDGKLVRLRPPKGEELPPGGFVRAQDGYAAPADDPDSVAVEISPKSERLQVLEPFPAWDGKDFERLPVLVKVQGKTTTDQISPAGPWLRFRGHLDRISDNMFIGAVNAFTQDRGKGVNLLTGEAGASFASTARELKARGQGWLVIGDDNYGEGSSREHAAMSPRYLGCKAVLAKSFARIHETNLKKQGVLPLVFDDPKAYDLIEQNDRVSIVGLRDLQPGRHVEVQIHKPDGRMIATRANHSLTDKQIGWFRAGSALNSEAR
jgi:aconitate hydratase A / 2-methylisocitrate dehydratase